MSLIQPKASIVKAQIPPLGELKGKANDAPVRILGQAYAKGTLRFRGFAGRLDIPSKKYNGVMRFEASAQPTAGSELCSFAEIVKAITGDEPVTEAPNV